MGRKESDFKRDDERADDARRSGGAALAHGDGLATATAVPGREATQREGETGVDEHDGTEGKLDQSNDPQPALAEHYRPRLRKDFEEGRLGSVWGYVPHRPDQTPVRLNPPPPGP